MWKWFLLALIIFCGLNWFILPNFPMLHGRISPVDMKAAIGLSGLLFGASLLFGSGK